MVNTGKFQVVCVCVWVRVRKGTKEPSPSEGRPSHSTSTSPWPQKLPESGRKSMNAGCDGENNVGEGIFKRWGERELLFLAASFKHEGIL